jgi:hypothetical protein
VDALPSIAMKRRTKSVAPVAKRCSTAVCSSGDTIFGQGQNGAGHSPAPQADANSQGTRTGRYTGRTYAP